MINADQARMFVKENLDKVMKAKIEQAIIQTAAAGKRRVDIDVYGMEIDVNALISELRENGFHAWEFTDYQERDIVIQW